MYTLVLDTEFKTTEKEFWDDDKGVMVTSTDFSPFNPDSFLVSVHWALKKDKKWIAQNALFRHSEIDCEPADSRDRVQEALDGAALLVAHNAKFDLLCIWANGFRYEGPVYDTMNGEYIAARGLLKHAINLSDSAKRHGVHLKDDLIKSKYFDNGITADLIPLSDLLPYGDDDVIATGELYDSQVNWFAKEENKGLLPTLGLTNEFCVTLARMEYRGMKVDMSALDKIEEELRQEYDIVEKRANETVRNVMGDTPINIHSSEQLGWVVYSRKPRNKRDWSGKFIRNDGNKAIPINRNMSNTAFLRLLKTDCTKLQRTDMTQCIDCKGAGTYYRVKKDGTKFAKPNKCKTCNGSGILYLNNGITAGFKFTPPDATWISASGFSTSKATLAILEATAREKGNLDAEQFFRDIQRLNALSTYLNSFVKGIRKGVDTKWILRCNFNQTRTATGRLSASNPNFQNFPRGSTFPIKRAFVSRFAGGHIADVDFAQLEFRAAGELSGCERVREDVRNGVDVHSFTAKVLTGKSTISKDDRQAAKPDTFKPLYGGLKGTPAQEKYYKAFLEKYEGVAKWHYALQEEAIATKKITTPTGREFAFERVARYGPGKSSHATKIKNYPVQSFATADIVPWAVIFIDRALRVMGAKSVVVNTVHDSIVIDIAPGEEKMVLRVAVEAALSVPKFMEGYYGIKLTYPYEVEAGLGPNWLAQETVYYQDKATNTYHWKEEYNG